MEDVDEEGYTIIGGFHNLFDGNRYMALLRVDIRIRDDNIGTELSPFRAPSRGLCSETAFDPHIGNLQKCENLNQHILKPNNALSF